MTATFRPTRVRVWSCRAGWFWDIAENSGGYDAVSPAGPHASQAEAQADACACFGACAFEAGRPDHYPQGEADQ